MNNIYYGLPMWAWIGLIVLGEMYFIVSSKRMKIDRWRYKNITREDIDVIEQTILSYNGREFEVFCEKLFKFLGYKKVEGTKATNDEGKDLILNNDTYVELKAWDIKSNSVGRPQLQKIIGACTANGISKAMFITTSNYNKNALDYADKVNKQGIVVLELFTIDDILSWIKEKDDIRILELMGFNKECYLEKVVNK
jgi:hypothetical protein